VCGKKEKKENKIKNVILPLDAPEAAFSAVGCKGANLSRLIRAGIPVPPGFIITTAAYRSFVEANRLEQRVAELLGSADPGNPAALENLSRSIRDFFRDAAIPGDILREITGAYRQWDSRPAAVRSSATAEDLPGTSFAGLHDTYLNVRGEESLLDAVKRCWSSLWTARAISYRGFHGIDPAGIGMAVVVQRMVNADRSGILFTVNPMTGSRDELVINAVWGLGESVVGGRVTPDNVVMEKVSGEINQMDIARKEVKTVLADQGTKEEAVEPGQRTQPVLNREQAAELTRLGRTIETLFDAPQDVEWAMVNNEVHILQSRPVTKMPTGKTAPDTQPALFTGEAVVPGDDNWPILGRWSVQDFDGWTRANVGELWREPVSPLVASTVPMIISGAVYHSFLGVNAEVLDHIQWAKRFYGRIYYNEGALRHIISKELGLPATIMDRTRGNRRVGDGESENKLRPLKILRHLPVLRRLAVRQWSTGRALETLIPEIDRWVADFLVQSGTEKSDTEKSDRELWGEAMVWLERITRALKLQNDMSGYSQTVLAMLEQRMVRWFGRRDLALDLITGLPGIQAAEMGAALWQMARKIDDLGLTGVIADNDSKTALDQLCRSAEAEPVIKMLDSFLEKHGYRCPNEAEWLHPRWIDAPEQIIALAVGYLRTGEGLDLTETRARQRREEAVAWVEARVGPFRRMLFRRLLRRAQHAIRLRDNGKSHVIKASYPARRIAARFGRRWTHRGWLKQPEDIFFLTVPDVQEIIEAGDPVSAGLDLHKLVAQRRKAFEYWNTVDVPDNLGPDGKPVAVQPAENSTRLKLQGISASSGRIRGTARIIHDPGMALKMQPDEILVTRATDSGWSAVFPLIAGLVTEIGGQLSHSAILAREYGLPAVVNVQNATRQLQDGQTITIDCAEGCVYLEDTAVKEDNHVY
jgi:phosphohistidine swiveling domain-containing protein